MFNDFKQLVMRFKYILILLLGCCCWRCISIDDRFEEKDKAFKVYDIHITLYKEIEEINEPSILVISFYANNNVKKLYEKLQRKYCKYK